MADIAAKTSDVMTALQKNLCLARHLGELVKITTSFSNTQELYKYVLAIINKELSYCKNNERHEVVQD